MAAAQPAARDSMRENRTAAAVERVPGATRIMGVDPGLTRCGFSMLDMTADRKAHFVNVGVAGTIPAESLDQRILWIFNAASHWLDTYKPDALAIERIFAQEQVNTVIGTAHASGAVISAAAMRGVPVFFHTPSEVKAAVTGSGARIRRRWAACDRIWAGSMPKPLMLPMPWRLRSVTAGVAAASVRVSTWRPRRRLTRVHARCRRAVAGR